MTHEPNLGTSSSTFDNASKQMLEELFDMSGGYVMDFTNGTFTTFIRTCIGFDPYSRYEGSKAVILREIWENEPLDDVARLNLDLLERWRLNKLKAGDKPNDFDIYAIGKMTELFSADGSAKLSQEDLAFLDQDLAEVDLSTLPKELTSQEVIQSRLDEIDRALDAGAPLAVVFLVGSTLEGLLVELALAHSKSFASSGKAPKVKGAIKPVNRWTLSELISVSRALGVLSEDVAKHADQVRNFRNYIHPRQQLKEGFEPRAEAARIAQQVLRAALSDLRAFAGRES